MLYYFKHNYNTLHKLKHILLDIVFISTAIPMNIFGLFSKFGYTYSSIFFIVNHTYEYMLLNISFYFNSSFLYSFIIIWNSFQT